jgi:hypothetical protein
MGGDPKLSEEDDTLKELQDIKKLLVLLLLDRGVKAGAIAEVLGMDPGNFSREFPAKKLTAKRPAGE